MDTKRAIELYPRIKDIYERELRNQIKSGKSQEHAAELADAYVLGTVDELERCIVCLSGKYDNKK